MDGRRIFQTFDVLRAIAALSVVIGHLPLWFPEARLLGHSYLAVDFFFALSGFVLARAYEIRLHGSMKRTSFLTVRAIRLYPLLMLATLLGFAHHVLDTALHSSTAFDGSVFGWLMFGLLGIPFPDGVGPFRQFFPFNWPAWMVFFEMTVNIAFAAMVLWLTKARLIVLIAAAGVVLALVAVDFGRINVGRGSMFFLGGIPRATYPFFLGVLIHRLYAEGRLPRLRVPPWLCCAVMFGTFLMPAYRGNWNVVYDLFCAFLVYPALIAAACQHEPRPGLVVPARIGAELSFALYALHFPLLRLLLLALRGLGMPPGYSNGWVVAGVLIAILAPVWVAAKYFDQPLRRWLTQRLDRRRSMHSRESLARPPLK